MFSEAPCRMWMRWGMDSSISPWQRSPSRLNPSIGEAGSQLPKSPEVKKPGWGYYNILEHGTVNWHMLFAWNLWPMSFFPMICRFFVAIPILSRPNLFQPYPQPVKGPPSPAAASSRQGTSSRRRRWSLIWAPRRARRSWSPVSFRSRARTATRSSSGPWRTGVHHGPIFGG